ncbi:MAG: TadE/TadG family type IV pilus assembly protein [Acidimicrobiia bacterium]
MRLFKKRSDSQRGVVLVEMALVAPILILLVIGIMEFGLAFRDRLTVSNGTQSAGRVAAALGNSDDSDMAVLQAVEQSLGILPGSGGGIIKHVQIWKSNGAGAPVTACGAVGSGGSNCNWYEYDPSLPCNWNPCPDPNNGSPPVYGGGFTPAGRDVTLDSGGLDTVGITVLFAHNWITGIMPLADVTCASNGSNCWTDTALFRLEPQNFGS